jgi:phage/plasmid-like protein (TIGR03299 family)
MGIETNEWYNTQILIGMTDQRGKAWHWREDSQGAEPNHYPQAIPVADVHRRLFSWKAIKRPMYFESADGGIIPAENTVAVIRDDNSHLMGIFSESYGTHQYGDWLVKNLENMIDDNIIIGSAGLLKQGAVAWVSLEMPESVEVIEGFKIRPHLLATTSHNGSIATTYKKVTTFVVCDNTYSIALRENGESYSVRHSKYSNMRIQDARDALGIVHRMTEEMSRHIEMLSSVKISDMAFERILDKMVPKPLTTAKMAITRADNKRNDLLSMWKSDERVAPWRGTGLGAIQAFNTYNHHKAGTDKNRIERNMMGSLNGVLEKTDKQVLSLVLSN